MLKVNVSPLIPVNPIFSSNVIVEFSLVLSTETPSSFTYKSISYTSGSIVIVLIPMTLVDSPLVHANTPWLPRSLIEYESSAKSSELKITCAVPFAAVVTFCISPPISYLNSIA